MSEPLSLAGMQALLAGQDELALLDVREAGQFGDGHLLAATPLPFSRLELEIERLVPSRATRIVLCDGGDGVAGIAARQLGRMGYTTLNHLEGGPASWSAAGATLYEGVNTPSKAFGEMVERTRHTPSLTARELADRVHRGDDLVIIDGRPLGEHCKSTIPGSVCCPNGELALRIDAIVPDPGTTIVVNCAGRTRSIIGAQTLRELGLRNPVFALENGTQGWFLAGLPLQRDARAAYPETVAPTSSLQQRTDAVMTRYAVPRVRAEQVNDWLAATQYTTYIFDVRTAEEVQKTPIAGATHAPGGQLLQATDLWIAVRHARVVLVDSDGVRAGVVAMWLRGMGHDACVLARGEESALVTGAVRSACTPPRLPEIDHAAAAGFRLVDLRGSIEYRAGHAPGAVWSIRPRVPAAIGAAARVGLIGRDEGVIGLVAADLRARGIEEVVRIRDAPTTEASPDVPPDADCIDFVFFTHGRHDGNRAAAEQYLRWETGLLDRLSPAECNLVSPSFAASPNAGVGGAAQLHA